MTFIAHRGCGTSFAKRAGSAGWLVLILSSFTFSISINAQRIAMVVPEPNELSDRVANELSENLERSIKLTDPDAADAAFRSYPKQDFFNLATTQAKEIGNLLGTDAFVLVNTGTQRRTSLERTGYFESSAAIYLVSSRTGRLVYWTLTSFDAEDEDTAKTGLLRTLPNIAGTLSAKARETYISEIGQKAIGPVFPELPESESPEAKGLRPPIPYKRIKPEYTRHAYLFGIRATVEIEVNIDSDGKVAGTEIVRWAGYGLDESVENAVRSMNWRPAERSGKTLPTRVLLRYNFTKAESEQR